MKEAIPLHLIHEALEYEERGRNELGSLEQGGLRLAGKWQGEGAWHGDAPLGLIDF